MLKQFCLILAVTLVTVSSQAISRSGGGKIESRELGFTADAPATYARTNPVENSGLRLWSNTFLPGSPGFSPDAFIELRDYSSEFSQLATSDRVQTSDEFARLGWTKTTHMNACVDVYSRSSTNVTSVAIVWGPRRGMVVLGGVSSEATTAIDEIVRTLSLESGACAW